MQKLIMLKLGGSLVTDKSREEKVNFGKIDSLSQQIEEALKVNKKLRLLVGNGAGSFGHIQVEKYNIKKEVKTINQKKAFSKVSNLVTRLNLFVVSSLIRHQLPAVSIKASSIFISAGRAIKNLFADSIVGMIKSGFIPVIYGDMVYDIIKGGAVLSTDREFLELVQVLSDKSFKIEKIIFCGNTPGVLNKNGTTIKEINQEIFPKIEPVFFQNPSVDVTGGMKKKVEIALQIAKMGIKSYIIGESDLKKCLLGHKFKGTTVT